MRLSGCLNQITSFGVFWVEILIVFKSSEEAYRTFGSNIVISMLKTSKRSVSLWEDSTSVKKKLNACR